jgi:hypothetical protein
MQGFVDSAPAQNPFVTAFAEKLAVIPMLPNDKREALQSQAEQKR